MSMLKKVSILASFQTSRTCVVRCLPCNLEQRCTQSTDVGNVYGAKPKAERISQAMRSYLEKTNQYNEMMKQEVAEFEIGKRHLARIMGLDEDNITQQDIDSAIEYLLPSGLHDKKARPIMKHPQEIMPKIKAGQFGEDGRPYHSMFYTRFSNFYQLMHDIVQKQQKLISYGDNLETALKEDEQQQYLPLGSNYVEKSNFEVHLKEKITDEQYEQFIRLMDRFIGTPHSVRESQFIEKYRVKLVQKVAVDEGLEILADEGGRTYTIAKGNRKRAVASVKLWNEGHGHFTVNGKPVIDHFALIADRQQLLYPLHFLDCIGAVDVEATVEGGGHSGQAGAIRFAMSKALAMFHDAQTVEKMRIAGLLTYDLRKLERQKPGQSGARRKFTWKKR